MTAKEKIMDVSDAGNPAFEIVMESILARQPVSAEAKKISHLKKRLEIALGELNKQTEINRRLEAEIKSRKR